MSEILDSNPYEEAKQLYAYQKEDLDAIFDRIYNKPPNYHLLYQLPTGGGKTVIFCEITRKYIEKFGKKVIILTHRIELCKQTSKMLNNFNVKNKVINSDVKDLPNPKEFSCYVAMVETLKNRLFDDKIFLEDVGLVIVDEAHFNSFRKLFSSFKNSFLLGVTATPLSSNVKLPMYENYQELYVGHPISYLVNEGYLAKAKTISYDVGLTSLKIGINGDYTIKSSDDLYSNFDMQDKLFHAYMEHSLGKKTLIFNSGIRSSIHVMESFKKKGLDVKHLDNTNTPEERKEILKWFKKTPNAILTSVSILTTGFDEPTVETIILNRATRSLTLYFQMIGRGSRRLPNKETFNIIDLGNNAARFGLWTDPIDWQQIFKSPEMYLENLQDDATIEKFFRYSMPPQVRALFSKTAVVTMDIENAHREAVQKNLRPKVVLEASMNQHADMCLDNSETLNQAKALSKILLEDIECRIRIYTDCLTQCSKNYASWLVEDYQLKLVQLIGKKFRERSWE
jgi:superfamily II DNA or RNA helicase